MATDAQNAQESDFPNIGNPAKNALNHEGYFRLDQLTQHRAKDILKIHGVGPKAIRILREAMAAKGLVFADEDNS